MNHDDLAALTAGMTTRRWIREVPARWCAISRLRPIQERPATLYDSAAARRLASESVDPAVHVVVVDGEWWIEDGHHRYWRALEEGATRMLARIVRR